MISLLNPETTILVKDLNDIQKRMMTLCAEPMSKEMELGLRRVIVNYLSDELDREIERVVAEKGITDADFEVLKHQHQRTPVK